MRIAVLTLYTPNVADVGDISAENKRQYCAVHQYEFVLERNTLDSGRPAAWSKLLLIQKHLPRFDWVFWTDHDSLIMRFDVGLEPFCDDQADMVITTDSNGVNTGQIFLRNTERTLRFLRQAWEQKEFILHQWHEQMAIIELLKSGRTDIRVKYLPQRTFNSYPDNYQPGDFLIHFAGDCDKLALMKQYSPRVSGSVAAPVVDAAHAIAVGLEHHQAGRLEQAEASYRQVLKQDPTSADAFHLLGVIAHQRGQHQRAVELIRQAIVGNDAAAHYHNNLGEALRALQKFEEATEAYRRALLLTPAYPAAHYNIGCALQQLGKMREAEAHYRAALELRPDYVEALNNLGIVLGAQARYEPSLKCYQQVIALKPDYVAGYNNLGTLLMRLGRWEDAQRALEKALSLRPEFQEAHGNLAIALRSRGRLAEAVTHTIKALENRPDYAEAHYELALTLLDLGRVDEAIDSLRNAQALKPDYAIAHGAMLLALLYQDRLDADAIALENRCWASKYADPLTNQAQPHRNRPDPQRRLRVGYLSYDFRQHSVDRFVAPIVASHDRGGFEVFCYSAVQRPDASTSQIQRHADGWRDILGMTDEQAVELIRNDGIDILVDLEGHTIGNRLGVFARKPAPIQISYIGFANTTGMDAIEYRFGDALADPPGESDRRFTEKLVRLPQCFLCYEPPEPCPALAPPPALAGGGVRFACFNILAKMRPRVLQLWARLLDAAPQAKLLIKTERGLEEEGARGQWLETLAANGIPPHRVELHGMVPSFYSHLEFYSRADIILDPFPYNGTTTTCEALWMGVPVVTLAGHAHVSRVGVSLLTNAGLGELIANTPDEYVQIAASLAADINRLKELRSSMRDRLRSSPLLDGPARARQIEEAFRRMWQQWCLSRT